MSRLFLSSALACLMLVTPSFAKDMTISDVIVSLDVTAVTNKAAALRYAHVTDDLKAAFLAELLDRVVPEGSKLTVDLSAVELSNSFTETIGTADTHLVGLVSVFDIANNAKSTSFTLTIDVNQAKSFFPATVDMTTLKASSDEYYHAMIQAFAKNAIAEIDK